MTRSKIAGLDLTEAFNEAIRRAVVSGIFCALTVTTFFNLARWNLPGFGGIVFVAVGVGAFVATLALIVGYYHRLLLAGILSAAVAFLLPIMSVIIPFQLMDALSREARFLVLIPVGIVGELTFEIIKKLHFKLPSLRDKGRAA